MEERMEGCRKPVWRFRDKRVTKMMMMMMMESEAISKLRRRGRDSLMSHGPVMATYVTFACRPHLRCGPASPSCLLASESTGGRCPTGFHGPAR